MSEEQAKEITERLFTTSSGLTAAKLIQADEDGGPIDELDFETVQKILEACEADED